MSKVLLLSVAAIVFCVSAAAQTATGTIQGRVVDGTGSGVPEATVNIENQNTGVRQATITNLPPWYNDAKGVSFAFCLLQRGPESKRHDLKNQSQLPPQPRPRI